jgi:diguanylate cyclase (GGDEF)-like protein|tara:strand:+ start:60192 stop:61733 length:1542 start_codon:yes stop_codon:yes gene_type:complete
MKLLNDMSLKLTLMFASLFGISLIVLFFSSRAVIHTHAANHALADVRSATGNLVREWQASSASMHKEAALLARDFGFIRAAASFHGPTIESALRNLSARNQRPLALFITQDGEVHGTSDEIDDLGSRLSGTLESGRRTGTLNISDATYWVSAEPVRAPLTIGWVLFGNRLDGNDGSGSRASPVKFLQGRLMKSVLGSSAQRESAVAQSPTAPVRGGYVENLIPLPSLIEGDDYVMRLRFPISEASKHYQTIAWKIAGLSSLIFLVVLAASWILAKRIVRPISTLGHMVNRAREGEAIALDVKGNDEVAQLARGLTGMSLTIAQLTHVAHHDPLTKLPNRRAFDNCLAAAFQMQDGKTSFRETGLLLIDLDDFKSINDTHGHPVGDVFLEEISRRLNLAMTSGLAGLKDLQAIHTALPARLGGDEFALILIGSNVGDMLNTIAVRFLNELETPVLIDGLSLRAGASIGAAVAPWNGRRAADLLAAADSALYRAKKGGKGRLEGNDALDQAFAHA